MKVSNAIADIEACDTLEGLKATMQKIVETYGFCAYDFVDAGDTHSRLPFYLGTSPERFIDTYIDNDFVTVDPCVAKARRTNVPFVWADAFAYRSRRGPKPAQRRLMEAAADFGFTEGLVVPCHFRDRIGRMHSASSVFFWSDPVQRFQFLLSEKRGELHLLMIYFIERCIAVRSQEKPDRSCQSNALGSVAAGQVLTDRERDVLGWAARGKTTSEIADILGVKSDTVDVHFKNNLRKLGASNRTQAVAMALVQGLIDV